jgi:hypothetical protein
MDHACGGRSAGQRRRCRDMVEGTSEAPEVSWISI